MSTRLQKVICVDDDPDILDITRMCLETVSGFQVHCCSSAAEMLASVDDVKPDLILLDVMMPKMDGPTVLRQIRQDPAYNHIPVIFLTARIQTLEVDNYLKMGATGVIAKPFDPMTLSETIIDIYNKHGTRSAL